MMNNEFIWRKFINRKTLIFNNFIKTEKWKEKTKNKQTH